MSFVWIQVILEKERAERKVVIPYAYIYKRQHSQTCHIDLLHHLWLSQNSLAPYDHMWVWESVRVHIHTSAFNCCAEEILHSRHMKCLYNLYQSVKETERMLEREREFFFSQKEDWAAKMSPYIPRLFHISAKASVKFWFWDWKKYVRMKYTKDRWVLWELETIVIPASWETTRKSSILLAKSSVKTSVMWY